MLFFKETLSIEDEKLLKAWNQFVLLFARAIASEVPLPKV